MSYMYKKILVPVDGSQASFDAIQHAINIAKMNDGRIDLIHVVNIMNQVQVCPQFQTSYLSEDYLESFGTVANEILAEAISKIPKPLIGQVAMRSGNPRESLKDFIEHNRYDLVIVGSRGLGALPGLLLGSVSQFLVKHVECPIMVIK